MGSPIKIKSAAKVREEEELLAQAKKVCAEQPRTVDRDDYMNAVTAFTNQALSIRAHINEKYPELCEEYPSLKTFRAAFEEVPILLNVLSGNGTRTIVDDKLKMDLLLVQYIDMAMEYEARALKIAEPRSWMFCWALKGEVEYPYTDDQNYAYLLDHGLVKKSDASSLNA